jgi:glycosyltransferase involved in cell wall biosynthesis
MSSVVHPSLTVTIAISSLGAGLGRIRLPEPKKGIDYLVLSQGLKKVPVGVANALLEGRDDVTIVELRNLGLSNSRNAGLELATGDLLLFSDDDIELNITGILALRDHFLANDGLSLVAGWRAERLPLGARKMRLTRFNAGRICAPEFMVRRAQIKVRFDTNFGIGARFGLGEDYVFITDVLGAGGLGDTIPVATGSHPHASTGENWTDPKLLTARRAIIYRVFGAWAPLFSILYLIRHRRRFRTLRQACTLLIPIKA